MSRTGEVHRKTGETDIEVSINLDGTGICHIDTGIGFFDHMLDAFGRHGLFDLTVKAKGDLDVDGHHTVEDTGIVLGQAIAKAIGDKKGIRRYGSMILPMDEALASASLDLSGRALLVFEGAFPRDSVGGLATEMVPHFFRSLCDALGANLHLSVRGENTHHMVEACFKAFARALRQAIRRDGLGIPSTKGAL